MTDKDFLRQYWEQADRLEDAFLRKARRLHPEDAVQAALDRFGRGDGTARLDSGELSRLHRDIEKWRDAGILIGEFGLRARDAEHRKRITNDEALLICLMSVWTEYYVQVETYAVQMFAEAAGAPVSAIQEWLAKPMPTAPAPLREALTADAAYRARQIQKQVQIDRQQDKEPDVDTKRYDRVFDQAGRWLLAPSAPTASMPNGHHGYLDKVMANLLSYFAIEAYKRQGVKQVQFVAVIDDVTTHNCRRLHGQIFDIDALRPGINAPPIAEPIHHCRSVLKPIGILQNDAESGTILPDIVIGKSVGAAAFRDPVKLPNGKTAKLAEGTKITKVYVFAGNGAKKPVRVAELLARQYSVSPEEWQHIRGDGYVDVGGVTRHAELHWFEHPDVGRVKMKVKRWFDEG